MEYAEKERHMYYDLAFFALLAIILIICVETGYIELLQRYIYVAMIAPYLIGRWVSGKFIYRSDQSRVEDKITKESVSCR